MYNTLQQSLDFILGSRYNTLRWHVYSSITTGSHAALRISQKITNNFVSSNFMRLDQNFRWFILQSLQIDYSQTVNSCQISQIAKHHQTPNGKGKKYKTGKWMTLTLANHRNTRHSEENESIDQDIDWVKAWFLWNSLELYLIERSVDKHNIILWLSGASRLI